jgi:DNA-binding NarL/FixJ family response regulator
MTARLIIADDHPMVCQGLCELISCFEDLIVVAIARDGTQAERLARTIPAELLILDITMPVKGGIKVLEALRADGITLPALFFSMHPANQYVSHIKSAGGQGFIGKESDGKSVLGAIRRILAGGTSFPNTGLRHSSTALSPRENEVMQGLLCGTPLVEIAAELGIDARSASTYRRRVLDKLEVRNNLELINLINRPG